MASSAEIKVDKVYLDAMFGCDGPSKLVSYSLFHKRKLGSGSFGSVVVGQSGSDHKALVAVKIEKVHDVHSSGEAKRACLKNEYHILKRLNGRSDPDCQLNFIPQVHAYGEDANSRYMVMDLFGRSLSCFFEESNKRRFPLRLVLQIAVQLIDRICFVHAKGVLHNDIKPENVLVRAQIITFFKVQSISNDFDQFQSISNVIFFSNRTLTAEHPMFTFLRFSTLNQYFFAF